MESNGSIIRKSGYYASKYIARRTPLLVVIILLTSMLIASMMVNNSSLLDAKNGKKITISKSPTNKGDLASRDHKEQSIAEQIKMMKTPKLSPEYKSLYEASNVGIFRSLIDFTRTIVIQLVIGSLYV